MRHCTRHQRCSIYVTAKNGTTLSFDTSWKSELLEHVLLYLYFVFFERPHLPYGTISLRPATVIWFNGTSIIFYLIFLSIYLFLFYFFVVITIVIFLVFIYPGNVLSQYKTFISNSDTTFYTIFTYNNSKRLRFFFKWVIKFLQMNRFTSDSNLDFIFVYNIHKYVLLL